jgi:tRNA threonylcarbamoyladenosine biosynthesis protein TsaE
VNGQEWNLLFLRNPKIRNYRETIFEWNIFAKQRIMIYGLNDIDTTAAAILKKAGNARIFAFTAEMGSGKTTFITALCRQLQVKGKTSSPSFSIINEYATSTGEPVYHLDLYRVHDLEEAVQAGVLELVEGNHYCFIEWPALLLPFLPGNTVYITMQFAEEKKRKIEITASPAGSDKIA